MSGTGHASAAPRPLALSTMYFQRWADQRDLAPFFEEGRRMGFDDFELSHILEPETVAAVDPAVVRIAAVHHPCPTTRRPQCFLTSSDASTRRQAVAELSASLATAARLGAGAVVVHLGQLEDDEGLTGHRLRFELTSRFRAGQRSTAPYADVLERTASYRTSEEPAHLDRALEGLADVAARAADLGIRLGLETGHGVLELPTPDGLRRLLTEIGSAGLGAWLDTGHVGAQANLGMPGFDEWHGAVEGDWLGVHCHDVVGLRDHLVPGMGGVDFAALADVLPSEAIVTCEVDWYFEPREVSEGAARLREALSRQAPEAPETGPGR